MAVAVPAAAAGAMAVPFTMISLLVPERVRVKPVGLQRWIELANNLGLERGMADAHLLCYIDRSFECLHSALPAIHHEVRSAQHVLRAQRPYMEIVHRCYIRA